MFCYAFLGNVTWVVMVSFSLSTFYTPTAFSPKERNVPISLRRSAAEPVGGGIRAGVSHRVSGPGTVRAAPLRVQPASGRKRVGSSRETMCRRRS